MCDHEHIISLSEPQFAWFLSKISMWLPCQVRLSACQAQGVDPSKCSLKSQCCDDDAGGGGDGDDDRITYVLKCQQSDGKSVIRTKCTASRVFSSVC